MDESKKRDRKGQPSDYGSRTLADTADGEPRVERGTADSALTNDEEPRLEEKTSSTNLEDR